MKTTQSPHLFFALKLKLKKNRDPVLRISICSISRK